MKIPLQEAKARAVEVLIQASFFDEPCNEDDIADRIEHDKHILKMIARVRRCRTVEKIRELLLADTYDKGFVEDVFRVES